MSRLEEGSNKWPKASLQVLHRLWSEHGALVHSQQEVQAMLSISQVCIHLIFNIVSIFHRLCLYLRPMRLCCFCCIVLVSGHAVEARHGSELRHLPISQLPICVSTAKDR